MLIEFENYLKPDVVTAKEIATPFISFCWDCRKIEHNNKFCLTISLIVGEIEFGFD